MSTQYVLADIDRPRVKARIVKALDTVLAEDHNYLVDAITAATNVLAQIGIDITIANIAYVKPLGYVKPVDHNTLADALTLILRTMKRSGYGTTIPKFRKVLSNEIISSSDHNSISGALSLVVSDLVPYVIYDRIFLWITSTIGRTCCLLMFLGTGLLSSIFMRRSLTA